jgi:hypothetical protein
VRAHEVPLLEITAALQANREDCIEVAFEAYSGQPVAPIIPAVTHVRLQATEEGSTQASRSPQQPGAGCAFAVAPPYLPERVDGI